MTPPGNDEFAERTVLEAALDLFVRKGFANTRLDEIAQTAGVTRRQLTYHYRDKTSLYRETLRYGLRLLHIPAEQLRSTADVPVEAMREVIGRVFDAFFSSPNSVRLITAENLHPILPPGESGDLVEQHPAVQEYDRILLLGRDLGAFRTDVSALDIHFICASMCCFPTLGDPAFHGIYSMPLTAEALRDRTRALVTDTIIGFLTSSSGGSGDTSYTGIELPAEKTKVQIKLADEVYGEDDTQVVADEVAPDFTDIYQD
ncbi:TetR family transcriptional regulator [Corynebacterium sp. TAE3-ERU12]|uniref:TetR/AcrR family transcriptional regulator n=1 Tax=Corynebacterium sp. TAE3-ERU12 TaxID=2849491 RepID=UPI001C48AAAE|nr:TetR family transcriptional regulator [Corynebacterium sp. TAE3-ERU12]MBV7294968.1 TetR family transcriptional regulator [Corynebacterium sp. TAE3-ERU12]